jgi:hypothetical protein
MGIPPEDLKPGEIIEATNKMIGKFLIFYQSFIRMLNTFLDEAKDTFLGRRVCL